MLGSTCNAMVRSAPASRPHLLEADRLQSEMNTRLAELKADMKGWFRTLTWVINLWFSFLTLLTVLFKFLRF